MRPLAHLRFPVEESLGRRYPELAHPYRNDFQRDRDRIVHARAFRRLEDKTQVFSPSLHDHFRNRLTHTIEVAQVSRTIALVLGLDEDLTEALALAHDVGHPPFAHAGEEELDLQMRRYGSYFEHNLHSLRIVDTVEHHYARFPGLNLTFEVREGIVKHSREIEPGEFPELEEYLPGLRPPLEAQIIDLADEIAYNTADLDDGYSAGMFSMEDIVGEVPHYEEIFDAVETQFAGASAELRFLEALRSLINFLVGGLLEGTHQAVPAEVTTVADVRRYPERLVRFTAPALETSTALKQFLRQHVYLSEALVAERQCTAADIPFMFGFLMENPDRLPDRKDDEDTPLHRRVCDYIAGMTDGYFRRTLAQYQRVV
ncbi:MAG: dNTP triphosphohydrolase [Bryobacteraceae bacterium]|nr:dNTP triphosphohydrolase [Bryobacteraceae bacterium]